MIFKHKLFTLSLFMVNFEFFKVINFNSIKNEEKNEKVHFNSLFAFCSNFFNRL